MNITNVEVAIIAPNFMYLVIAFTSGGQDESSKSAAKVVGFGLSTSPCLLYLKMADTGEHSLHGYAFNPSRHQNLVSQSRFAHVWTKNKLCLRPCAIRPGANRPECRLANSVMIDGMSRPARQRLVKTLVLIASLLFQQVAMAAYVCTIPTMQIESVVMAKHCAGMESVPAQQPDAVCQKHCAPEPTSADASNIPLVPPVALPPVMHAREPATHRLDVASREEITRVHPPPRLRYCRLLI